MTHRKHSFPQRTESWLQRSRIPNIIMWRLQFKGCPQKKVVERSHQMPLETHRKAATMLTFQKEKERRVFHAAAFLVELPFLASFLEKEGRWVMAARPCKSPEGSWHELLSGLLAQRPYYNTHIKMCGQDLEGWSPLPPSNSLPTPRFECICVYTPSDRIGSSCCHGAETSVV